MIVCGCRIACKLEIKCKCLAGCQVNAVHCLGAGCTVATFVREAEDDIIIRAFYREIAFVFDVLFYLNYIQIVITGVDPIKIGKIKFCQPAIFILDEREERAVIFEQLLEFLVRQFFKGTPVLTAKSEYMGSMSKKP